jgi:hypothetical protein
VALYRNEEKVKMTTGCATVHEGLSNESHAVCKFHHHRLTTRQATHAAIWGGNCGSNNKLFMILTNIN